MRCGLDGNRLGSLHGSLKDIFDLAQIRIILCFEDANFIPFSIWHNSRFFCV